jgi:hypothetical protein
MAFRNSPLGAVEEHGWIVLEGLGEDGVVVVLARLPEWVFEGVGGGLGFRLLIHLRVLPCC